MKSCFISLVLCLTFAACEDLSTDKPLYEPTNVIVVDGTITSEKINHLIQLSFPYQTQNGTSLPVSGAVLMISVDGANYLLTESPTGSGLYYTPVFGAVTGKTYMLTIQYAGRTFYATDTPPAVEAMPALHYEKTIGGYSLDLTPSGTQANYIRHDFDWTGTSACNGGGGCDGEIIYYDLKTIDVNDLFKPDKEPFYFPAGAKLIRRKYSVSPEYKSFLRSVLSETEWHGGVFDVQRAPVTTNLSDGAIGFFGVSTIVADSTIIP